MKLIVDNIVKNFDKKGVLKNASFTFKKGKIYGLLGRNVKHLKLELKYDFTFSPFFVYIINVVMPT